MVLPTLVKMLNRTYMDLSTFASQYVQVSAVLAGFAFAGLILVMLVLAVISAQSGKLLATAVVFGD